MKGGQRSTAIYTLFIVISVLAGLGAMFTVLNVFEEQIGVAVVVVIVAIIIGTAIQVKILGDISWLIERENSRSRRR